jgi:diaminopimelate epimerase
MIKFTKMHGIGNDYIYIDTFEQNEPEMGWVELAKRVADRRFGVGGDGLILIEPPRSEQAHGTMRMFNADGSESEMCGNGLRCVSKYLHDFKYKGLDHLDLDTGVGCLGVDIVKRHENGLVDTVKINMGEPILKAEAIPNVGLGMGQEDTLEVDGQEFKYTAVSMGNPHCVIFVDSVADFPVEKIGSKIENMTSIFPNRVNIEFIEVISKTQAKQRTWERGSGETLACGTGASAVGVAGTLRGHFEGEVHIELLGGDLDIAWGGEGQPVWMTGPASYICHGTLDPQLLDA